LYFILKNPKTKDLGISLRSLFANVDKRVEHVDKAIETGQENVEKWFDNSMDRLSGWYRRWTQKIAFGVALVIAIVFNIDSLYMGQELWRNPAMREASSAYIQSYVEKETANEGDLSKAELKTIQASLEAIEFPTGWHGIPKGTPINLENIKHWIFWHFWLIKIIGWLVSAVAAMQGAPFWFDILKKLVNVRSTGTNPKEKEQEKGAAVG